MIRITATASPRNALALTPFALLLACLAGSAGMGCAKVMTTGSPTGGTGGAGSGPVITLPPIPNLESITIITVTNQPVTLTGAAGALSATSSFTAQGKFTDGTTSDITDLVNWSLDPRTGTIAKGNATVTSPGVYDVRATSGLGAGSISAVAKLTANYAGKTTGVGFNTANESKLDGAVSGALTVGYPLDGAIFPSNFGAVTVQLAKTGAQDIARLAFAGDGLDVQHYGTCEAGPGTGCYVTLPSAVTKLFLASSARNDIKMTARLGSASGGAVAESAPVRLAWANVPLSGGLYYWTTINPGAIPNYTAPDPTDPRGTAVMRYNFEGDLPKRELVWTDRGSPLTTPPFRESPPAVMGSDPISMRPAWGEGRCIGCHAITPNGKLMAFSIGGSDASSWGILTLGLPPALNELDPTASGPNATGLDALKRYRRGNFATFTTFSPGSDLMVTMYRGKLALREVNPGLATVKDDLFAAATTERKTDPFWSPDGKFFTFTSFDLNQEPQTSKYNGDTKTSGQIWIASADASSPREDARIIVPRQAGVTSYYPAISHDSRMLVFNKSSCSGAANPGGYGTGPCDGYDDITASLWLTDPTGKPPSAMTNANGGENNSNSWPRWSPDKGSFRGQDLYWVAFSSRRPYGYQVNSGAGTGAKPQLWFAAVLVGGEFAGGDPSRGAVWLPEQNLNLSAPTGNHVPQWVKFVVPIE
ncbi:MAG: hypothetical protein ABUL77_03090 [Bacteroidota bacterium]